MNKKLPFSVVRLVQRKGLYTLLFVWDSSPKRKYCIYLIPFTMTI